MIKTSATMNLESITESESTPLVLIVDDSASSISMLSDALETADMSTLVALEGQQALKIARKMLPDIIVLDAVMPGLDGFEVCSMLKSDPELSSIPVIFMTGLSETDNIVRGFAAGGVDYVTKPIDNEEFIARIRVHLANHRLLAEARTALDLAGQNVLCVSVKEGLVWSTPEVKQLLSESYTEEFSENLYFQTVSKWLSDPSGVNSPLSIVKGKLPLTVKLLGKLSSDQFLLKVESAGVTDPVSELENHLPLTHREAEVLLWISRGKANNEIAIILGTSPKTINKHTDSIYKKLGVENRTSAATHALQTLQNSN